MKIGTGTYAYYWRIDSRGADASLLPEMLTESAALGAEVFQICDFAALEGLERAQLRTLRRQATDVGLDLEIGTRGVEAGHLGRFLQLAEELEVSLVRSMLSAAGESPDLDQAVRELERALPAYRRAGVTLGLETYEQVTVEETIDVIERVGADRLGICLDPANSVGAFEMPGSTIERTAPYVVNIHVKDFGFGRREGGQGFTLTGRALGEGSLDLDGMVDAVARYRDVNLILEHWVPWQEDEAATLRLEADWTARGMAALRDWGAARGIA